jgi:hypothetical protein
MRAPAFGYPVTPSGSSFHTKLSYGQATVVSSMSLTRRADIRHLYLEIDTVRSFPGAMTLSCDVNGVPGCGDGCDLP